MPDQRLHDLLRSTMHHLKPLARGQGKHVLQFELEFPLRVVLSELKDHN